MKIFFPLKGLCLLTLLLSCSACTKQNDDLFSSVSENRSNIFLAENDELHLKIHAVKKESPYLSDGVARETSWRTEVFLTAPSGEKESAVSFTVNGNTYGGDLSYDNVKSEYFYFVTLDISTLQSIPVTVTYGDTVVAMNAVSVLEEGVLSTREVLKKVKVENEDAFRPLITKHGFDGEIYVRLVYEGAPYYYVGVVDKNGKLFSMLADGKTGKTLATRNG